MGHDLTSSYAIRSIAMRRPICGRPSSSRAIFAVGIQPVRVGGFDGRAGLVARLRAGICVGRRRRMVGAPMALATSVLARRWWISSGMPHRAPCRLSSRRRARPTPSPLRGPCVTYTRVMKAKPGTAGITTAWAAARLAQNSSWLRRFLRPACRKNGGTQSAPKNKATSDSLAHSMSGLDMHARPRADAAQVGGRSGILYHQTSYCTPTSVREVLPLAPKLPAFAMAAAWFQLALVTYRRSSGRDQKSSDKARAPASVSLFRRWSGPAPLRVVVDSSARALTFFVNAYAPRPPSVKSLVVTLVRSTLPVW